MAADPYLPTSPICPGCKQRESRVIDTRGLNDGRTYRRRKCPCGFRFTTYEVIRPEDVDRGAAA